MSKRTFTVNISFKFELDIDEMKEWRRKTWGYGQCPIDAITKEKVHEELHTCLSSEFCRDEAGLCYLPKDFKLEVIEDTLLQTNSIS